MKKTTIIGVVTVILVIGAMIWFGRPAAQKNDEEPARSSGVLSVEEANNYDFGTISMAAGVVKHAFKIKNTSTEAVTISKMYTSCMCTTATLMMGDKQFGPYGMAGHGFIPKIGQAVSPGEEASVEIVFDPAAHGPAGVGRIERSITVENNAGQPLELLVAATVTP